MKIKKVEPDNRRRRFDVTTSRGTLPFPFARCDPAPSPNDRLAEVFVDPELRREAFTYRLESGAQRRLEALGIHVDAT